MPTTPCAKPGASRARLVGARLGLAGAVLVGLAGCATFDPDVCARFDAVRGSTSYETVYRYSEADTRNAVRTFKTVARKNTVTVRWYTLRVSADATPRCAHMYLYKDLYIERDARSVELEERREFYTASGKLIAVKKEDLSRQLRRSGYYSASVPLPIPEAAPAGRYRVVTRLVLKNATPGRDRTLATATAEFRVSR